MVNKVIFQGRLTKDPELRQTQSGISSLLFTVAWSETYKEVETKCFLFCKAWRGTAEFISRYFIKGKEIVIEGHMVTEKWGDDKDVTLCMVDKAHFCGSGTGSGSGAASGSGRAWTPPAEANNGFVNVPDDVSDEELPFN